MVQTPNDSLFKQIIEDVYPKTTFNSEKFDLLYAIELNQTGFDQLLSKHVLHNDSMILIEGIHSNPEKERQWESLIQNSNITVSIDMFYCGALFIRKEQVKEHFIIRI